MPFLCYLTQLEKRITCAIGVDTYTGNETKPYMLLGGKKEKKKKSAELRSAAGDRTALALSDSVVEGLSLDFFVVAGRNAGTST